MGRYYFPLTLTLSQKERGKIVHYLVFKNM